MTNYLRVFDLVAQEEPDKVRGAVSITGWGFT